MSDFKLSYKPFGNKAILIEWPPVISEAILKDILSFKNKLQDHYTNFYDISTAYNSLTIYLKTEILDFQKEVNKLNQIYILGIEREEGENYIWHIPVCYDKDVAPDLDSFLKIKNLELQQFIKLHSQNLYTVYFLGFLPGFPYLGGLPKELHIARKSNPNLNIKRGSVGIGGHQTGVYTIDSPGGWYVIGKTPIQLFDISLERPSFLKAGDKIKFYAVSKDVFLKMTKNVALEKFILKKEISDV